MSKPPGPAPSLEILMQPTDQLTQVDGVLCRVWQGETDEGEPVSVFVYHVTMASGRDIETALPAGRLRGAGAPKR